MKNSFLLTILLSGLLSLTATAQCDPNLTNLCIPNIENGFNLLKSYKVDGYGSRDKVEYSYVFTKGTIYLVNLCADESTMDGIVVSLFDRKRNKVASNIIDGQIKAKGISFPCNATGIYYIQYSFTRGNSLCAGSTLAFKR